MASRGLEKAWIAQFLNQGVRGSTVVAVRALAAKGKQQME
jgi:hypothetical protein